MSQTFITIGELNAKKYSLFMVSVFETYQKARLVFVQTMAELATRATNVKCLQSAGVLGKLS